MIGALYMDILIVEDSRKMRQLIANFVSDLADHLYECSDGSEALTAYTQYRPDWVLMDLNMRQVDGLAATRQIMAAFPEARIMIVTAYEGAALREAARKAGACAYVLKDQLPVVRQILSAQANWPQ